uniref:Nephronectin a n=1 Tax=Echeneis naucrates TaxID=173247 RepID=A0A665U3B2_ECHNA
MLTRVSLVLLSWFCSWIRGQDQGLCLCCSRTDRAAVLSGGLCRYGNSVECCWGWTRTGGGRCRPHCQQGCKHGECVGPDKCKCHPGFTGKACNQDLNECGVKPRPCKHRCMNVIGSYKCYCLDGYTLQPDGSCRNARTCYHANCQYGCEVSKGAVRCTCPSPGLRLGPDLRTCVDIDECVLSGGGVCPRHRKCVNTFGSFVCKCHLGFKLVYINGRYTCIGETVRVDLLALALAAAQPVGDITVPKVTVEPQRPRTTTPITTSATAAQPVTTTTITTTSTAAAPTTPTTTVRTTAVTTTPVTATPVTTTPVTTTPVTATPVTTTPVTTTPVTTTPVTTTPVTATPVTATPVTTTPVTTTPVTTTPVTATTASATPVTATAVTTTPVAATAVTATTASATAGVCDWLSDREGDVPWETAVSPSGGTYVSVPEQKAGQRSIRGARLTVDIVPPWSFGDLCFSFSHWLTGYHVGVLQLFTRKKGRGQSHALWSRTGGHGWRQTQVTLTMHSLDKVRDPHTHTATNSGLCVMMLTFELWSITSQSVKFRLLMLHLQNRPLTSPGSKTRQ